MLPPGRIILCLTLAVVALAATTLVLALRQPSTPAVAPTAPAVAAAPVDAAELRRLGASIEAHGVQMAQLRELIQAGGAGGAGNAVGAPRDLAALSERVEQTERNVQEILRIMRQIEVLVAGVGAGRAGGWTSYAPTAPTPTPTDALSQRRNLATGIKNDLRLIDAAIDQYAIEFNVPAGTSLTFPQLKPYFRKDTRLPLTGADVLGSIFGPTFKVGELPRVPPGTKAAMRDVADDQFWSPFQ